MSGTWWRSTILFSVCLLFMPALPALATTSAETEQNLEIGGPSPKPGDERGAVLLLDDLAAELEFGVGYTILTDPAMEKIYSGIPRLGVGISFLVSPHIRSFFRLGYGVQSGNPYHGVSGFDGGDDATVKMVPITLGMKINLAQSSRVRLQLGFGLQAAWQQETIPKLVDGSIVAGKESGTNFGFVGMFAPEFVLGNSNNLLGVEFSIGGSMGDISSNNTRSDINLTGMTARLYFAYSL